MLPLKGIRVLDLSRVLAGPFCSMLLGDMGAEIIKIEDTIKGDETRLWGPPFAEENSLYFWSVNRNKSSVAVNFKNNDGKKVIEDLIPKCDVLIENFLPGTLKKYNLDYDSVKSLNSNLVYCSITGFGQKGPMAHRPGYDVVVAGVGGLLNITGSENGPPCRVGVAVTDLMTGMVSLTSILSGLISRVKNGGCHLDCNLLSTQISMLFHIGANYLTDNIESSRIGTSHSTLVPYRAYLTSDHRYFIIGAGNDNQFKELCATVQMPEIASNERFLTNSKRVNNREELDRILEEKFSNNTLEYWVKLFQKSTLPNGPVNNLKDVFKNEQCIYSLQRTRNAEKRSRRKYNKSKESYNMRNEKYENKSSTKENHEKQKNENNETKEKAHIERARKDENKCQLQGHSDRDCFLNVTRRNCQSNEHKSTTGGKSKIIVTAF